jgi:hypothetical protein
MSKKPVMTSVTHFLNVDVDLRLSDGIDELLRYLEPSILVLNRTAQEASFELNDEPSSLEETLLNCIACVEALPPQAKELWRRCDMRQLNIGIQAGHQPYAEIFAISNETVASIANNQLEIVFTVYAPAASPREDAR